MIIMKIVLALLCCSLLAAPALADVYRWVDADGKVHYSDTPPPAQQPTERLEVETDRPRVPLRDEPEPAASPAPDDAQNVLRQKQCEVWQAALKTYSSGDLLVQTDADGNQKPLTPEERDAAILEARANVTAFCKPAAAEDAQQ